MQMVLGLNSLPKPMKTLVIAEAGVNHNGDVDVALRLIEAAADAGADIVKFQTFKADKLVTKTALKADYQFARGEDGITQYEMLKRFELSESMHHILIKHENQCGIQFLSTPFDADSLDFLESLGVNTFKISSSDITNLPYLEYLGRKQKNVILSSGMSTLADVEGALNALRNSGLSQSNITLLHCNTEYPTPMSDVNLKAMVTMRDAFNINVGYSDHTDGIEVSLAAVTLGASVIEKHFTLSRDMDGPDHMASIEPATLKEMVRCIRNIELALGDGVKRITDSESRNLVAARKSIVARRLIQQGEPFTVDNLAIKRPGNGISPMRWHELIGKRAIKRFDVDERIEI